MFREAPDRMNEKIERCQGYRECPAFLALYRLDPRGRSGSRIEN